MNISKLKRGFTLIEIVIVLAIAALIMVVVFLAVQGAQRSQRDQARKDIANRTLAAVTAFRGNNSGTAPASAAALQTYLGWTSNPTLVNGVNITLGATIASAAACTATTGNVSLSGTAPDTVEACLESSAVNYSVHN